MNLLVLKVFEGRRDFSFTAIIALWNIKQRKNLHELP